MKRAALLAALVAAAALAGCGDNSGGPCTGTNCADAPPLIDGRPDASPADDFTAFVHDQILNHTGETEDPVPFATFATLPDNDTMDDTFQAYMDLF